MSDFLAVLNKLPEIIRLASSSTLAIIALALMLVPVVALRMVPKGSIGRTLSLISIILLFVFAVYSATNSLSGPIKLIEYRGHPKDLQGHRVAGQLVDGTFYRKAAGMWTELGGTFNILQPFSMNTFETEDEDGDLIKITDKTREYCPTRVLINLKLRTISSQCIGKENAGYEILYAITNIVR